MQLRSRQAAVMMGGNVNHVYVRSFMKALSVLLPSSSALSKFCHRGGKCEEATRIRHHFPCELREREGGTYTADKQQLQEEEEEESETWMDGLHGGDCDRWSAVF